MNTTSHNANVEKKTTVPYISGSYCSPKYNISQEEYVNYCQQPRSRCGTGWNFNISVRAHSQEQIEDWLSAMHADYLDFYPEVSNVLGFRPVKKRTWSIFMLPKLLGQLIPWSCKKSLFTHSNSTSRYSITTLSTIKIIRNIVGRNLD